MEDLPDGCELLQGIESSLSCPICTEFLVAPVSLNCGHTFCSRCIRSNFDFKLASNCSTICPQCRAPGSTADLKPNLLGRQVVTAYIKARKAIVAVVLANKHSSDQPAEQNVSKGQVGAMKGGKEARPSKCTAVNVVDTSQSASTSGDVLDADSDYEPFVENSQPPNKRSKVDNRRISSLIPEGLVNCPICHMLINQGLVNSHIDNCLNKQALPEAKPRVAGPGRVSKNQPKAEVPPKLCYSLLKDKELRKKLQDLGLPTDGKRQDLIVRYSGFRSYVQAHVDGGGCSSPEKLVRSYLLELKHKAVARASAPTTQVEMGSGKARANNSYAALIENTKQRDANRKLCGGESAV